MNLIYDQLCAEREEKSVGAHYDKDGDQVADRDERDEFAHDDAACDQHQEDADRWTGATRDPNVLPVTEVEDG